MPYSGLNSSKSLSSTTRAITSRGSNGTFGSADGMPSSCSASMAWRRAGATRPGAALAVVQPADDLAAEADAVELVDGEVVGEPADPRVHLGAAERLVVALLAGRHLHERWPAEEHLRALLDHHDVVAHARHVRAAGGRVAEHDGDGRNARRRQLR